MKNNNKNKINKNDIFQGNLKKSGQFIAVYAILISVMVVIGVGFLIAYMQPVNHSNLSENKLVFDKASVIEKDLRFENNSEGNFYIYGFESYNIDSEKVSEYVDKGKSFDTYYYKNNDSFVIQQLICDDDIILSLYDIDLRGKVVELVVACVCFVLALVFLGSFIFFVHMIRHTGRYSKEYINKFGIKSSYIRDYKRP